MAHLKADLITASNYKGHPLGRDKKVSVRDVIDAIRTNGYTQVSGSWVLKDEDGKLYGCAIGQAAINLGVGWSSLSESLNHVHQKRSDLSTMGSLIVYLNDKRGKSTSEIADTLEQRFAHALDTTFDLGAVKY